MEKYRATHYTISSNNIAKLNPLQIVIFAKPPNHGQYSQKVSLIRVSLEDMIHCTVKTVFKGHSNDGMAMEKDSLQRETILFVHLNEESALHTDPYFLQNICILSLWPLRSEG